MSSSKKQSGIEDCNLCHPNNIIEEGHKGNHWTHVASKHIKIFDEKTGLDFTKSFDSKCRVSYVRANTKRFENPNDLIETEVKGGKKKVIVEIRESLDIPYENLELLEDEEQEIKIPISLLKSYNTPVEGKKLREEMKKIFKSLKWEVKKRDFPEE